MPEIIKIFGFNYCPAFKYIDWNDYILSLRDIASRTIKTFSLNAMSFTYYEFRSMLKAAKNTEIVDFTYCKIFTDSLCEFGTMDKCKIK